MENLEEILQQYGKERKLSPGEVLFHQGSVSDGVYYLKWGWLGVYRDEQDTSYLLSVISPGEMVGELAATTGRPRAGTVMAGKEACVIHVSEANFHRALDEAPALAAEIIYTMGKRLTNADTVRVTLGRSYHRAVDRIQALRSQKAQMEELLRLREELANMIVHDLHNPLGVITTGLSLLERAQVTETTPEYVTTVMETMRRSAQRMRRLTNTLLDIARLEKEEMMLRALPLDLKTLVEEVIAEEYALAEDKEMTLENRLPADLPAVLADRDLIQRVLVNLVDNALKFTPDGGRVWVEAQPNPENVQIEVVDSGPGIPLEERARIFEKFTQVQGRTGTGGGSGLGLAFCRMAVEAHGGHLWVEDGPEGSGSRFIFTIPKLTAPPAASPPREATARPI